MGRVFGTIKSKSSTAKRYNGGRVRISEEERQKYEDLAKAMDQRHKTYGQHLSQDNRKR
jgi:hypothetical protein